MTFEEHYDAACSMALEEVERYARKILKDNPDIHEFIMGMGTWDFKSNEKWLDNEDPRFEPLLDLISKWDKSLYITGNPMRFTATGPKITDW